MSSTIEDKDLFNEKQKFIYFDFDKILLTDKGKSFICQNEDNYDA